MTAKSDWGENVSINRLRWIIVAFVAGACGSLATRVFNLENISAAPAQPLRSTRFELIDSAGRTRAVMESGDGGGAKLRFFNDAMRTPLELGLLGGQPYLRMNGSDGRMRVTLKLIYGEKPVLLMGDSTSEQRLSLGVVQGDSSDPKADFWALLLGKPIDRDLLAAVAMNTSSGPGTGFGSLSVRSTDGKRWDALLESGGVRK
jgi:hypothetical protein